MNSTCALSLVLVLSLAHGVLGEGPRDIAELLKDLEGDAATRCWAMQDLENLGLDAAPAVPRLIRLLDAPDKETRMAAADALRTIGKDATAAIPKLVELLDEGELPRFRTGDGFALNRVGLRASWALGKMGQDAVAPLDLALASKNVAVRSNGADALREIGPAASAAVPSLIRLLQDREELVRERVIWALRDINPDPTHTTEALVECLADRDCNIRVAATNALGTIKPITPDAVEGLIRALGDEEGDVQHEAASALGGLGDDAIPAIPALIDMLKSRETYRYAHPVVLRPVAATAAKTLGALGPRAKDAMPALLELIQDRQGTFEGYIRSDSHDNNEARGAAAVAAARIDPASDDLLRVLGQALQDDERIRRNVAVALALVGPRARCMVPSLIRISESEHRVGVWVWGDLSHACAAVAIEPENARAVQRMLDLLPLKPGPFDDDDWALLRTALVQAGDRSRPAIPVLIRLLEDSSRNRREVALTLAVFGPEAESAIPALLELLTSSWHPRAEAIEAIQQIASEKSPQLLAALGAPNAELRSGVVEVLGHFPRALPLITEALDDPSVRVRVAALLSLAKLEGIAKPAIPRIRELLHADSLTIREAADLALQGHAR